jgi:hypothetical protein
MDLTEYNTLIDWIEKHPVVSAALIGCVAYTLQGIINMIRKAATKPVTYIKPIFWSYGKKYKILAVHLYLPSEDPSGYIQHQHSRPDQWVKLISINSSFMNCRHKITPVSDTDVLAIIISRDGQENHKVLNFNR